MLELCPILAREGGIGFSVPMPEGGMNERRRRDLRKEKRILVLEFYSTLCNSGEWPFFAKTGTSKQAKVCLSPPSYFWRQIGSEEEASPPPLPSQLYIFR